MAHPPKQKEIIKDLKVGDYLYIGDLPTQILEIRKEKMKKVDDYFYYIVHEKGTMYKRRAFSMVKIKPKYVPSKVIWSEYAVGIPIPPVKKIKKIKKKPFVRPTMSIVDVGARLVHYYRYIQMFKEGGKVCRCETITPLGYHCINCGIYSNI